MKNGYGKMKFNNQDIYKGNWENDQMSGEGKYIYKNGD